MIDPVYPAPSDARRKRRRKAGQAGSSFYIERGRPFLSTSDYRERRRDPEARQAVKLARELAKLAADFPRFRLAVNRLGHHVLTQVRSPTWKTRTVLKCLDQREASSVGEISAGSGLDFVSVTTTLEQLLDADRVVPCNRRGRPWPPFADTKKAYWLKK